MRKSQSGQSLVEYLIIVALIAVGSIAVMRTLSQTIYTRFANVTNALQNKNTDLHVEAITTEDYQKRGLNDFFKGAGNEGPKLP